VNNLFWKWLKETHPMLNELIAWALLLLAIAALIRGFI